jgi:hypothetical protein
MGIGLRRKMVGREREKDKIMKFFGKYRWKIHCFLDRKLQ